MFKNYLKTALRNLLRHKSNSFINIAGLIVGFAAFLLIFVVIQYEQSFDNFHPNKSNIYRVVRIGKNANNKEYRSGVPFPVTLGLRTDFPQLTNAAAISGDNNVQVDVADADGSVKKKFKETYVFTAEPQFFKMFNFPLAAGSINSLNEPNTVFLTKDVAIKYFGNWRKATNKTLHIYGQNMKVAGILKNPPANTDFPLSVVVSYATLTHNLDMNDWGSISDNNYCFVQLNKDYSRQRFDKLLAGFVDKHIKPVNPNYDLSLQPLSEIHYDERYGNFSGRTFSKDLILALSLIALFLLVIACVNFINLTTAQAINRAREVGVRKALGSNRMQLVWQFLGETGVTTFISLLFSLAVVLLCIPFMNNLLDIHLLTVVLHSSKFILFMLSALVVVTILSGFYPALVLSGFKSVNVLKGALPNQNNKGISLRRGLVILQFVIAQALIIGTLVVASQMNYFRTADMGFDKKAVINAGIPGDSLSRTKARVLFNELNKVPGVEDVSFSTFTPSAGGGWYTDLRLPDNRSNNPDMIVSMMPADTSFFSLYNLPLVAGRIYYPSDTMREFVVNEMVIKKLGIQNPENAIGKLVNVNGKTCPIVGVVKDFHSNSLRDPIGPIVMTTIKNAYGQANIKINMSKAKTVIAALRNIWDKNYPDYVFEYNFLDQSIAAYYKQENQLSQLYKIFAGIAIFISCLGLYGLISFMGVQRKKEIGIRKVLGAPVRDIMIMLLREFTILISIAFLIAAPIAWYFMNEWLQQYTYRITIGLWFFATTIISSLIIAWLTVGYTVVKAALANPVDSLRTE
ncbi:MAG TPA: ABC transporter permease [Hanamia sp.]|nr:ABC transporter permease [Hanamia sp.]